LIRFITRLKQHLVPEPALRAYVVIGAALLLLSVIAFGSLTEDVVEKESLVQFDQAIVNAIHTNSNPTLAQIMIGVSFAGSAVPTIATLILTIVFFLQKRYRDLILLLVTIAGAQVLNALLKISVQRARPSFADPLVTAIGFSFPSGHAMGAMVFYGLMAYFLMRDAQRDSERLLIFLIFLLTVGLIGFSRIYLGVHYPSDVLAGYLAGLGWLTITLNGSELLFRQTQNAPAQSHV
jgi:undecaprenyl-diphosphatase